MDKQLSFFQIKDFNELNTRKVIIFGASQGGQAVNDMLLRNNVEEKNILFFSDNNSNLWEKNEENGKKKIISPIELKEYCRWHKDVVIIIATVVERFYIEILKQLKEFKIENTILLNEEIILLEKTLVAIQNLEELEEMKIYKKILLQEIKHAYRYKSYDELLKKSLTKSNQFLFMLVPPKTGSSTVCKSLSFGYSYEALHTVFWMSQEDKINCKKWNKKMIIGVREAISQNISLIYQVRSAHEILQKWMNPQKAFDYYIVDSILNSVERRNEKQYGFQDYLGAPLLIQSWFEDELEAGLGINIFDYPFNKEEGYQIIKVDECEILLYRLESMNSLEKVFEEFLGIKDFKFAKANEAKFKWYNNSYQNFKKYVTMPQEYIDISYNNRYMKHFYTEEEILKFREKWEKHVDPNWSMQ